MVWEVETNRLVPLYTPLFFGWTISLNNFLKLVIKIKLFLAKNLKKSWKGLS
jgi:hypothetical protein